jgi:hypothetical protein
MVWDEEGIIFEDKKKVQPLTAPLDSSLSVLNQVGLTAPLD